MLLVSGRLITEYRLRENLSPIFLIDDAFIFPMLSRHNCVCGYYNRGFPVLSSILNWCFNKLD